MFGKVYCFGDFVYVFDVEYFGDVGVNNVWINVNEVFCSDDFFFGIE